MNRRSLSAIVTAAALALGGLTLAAPPAQAVTNVVPDAKFQACLNYWLGQTWNAPITATQLGTLTGRVACAQKGISSFAGAEYLTNVTRLDLGQNGVTDITPLAGLTKLTSLALTQNRIADITPLRGLTGLTVLGLTGNQIRDLTP